MENGCGERSGSFRSSSLLKKVPGKASSTSFGIKGRPNNSPPYLGSSRRNSPTSIERTRSRRRQDCARSSATSAKPSRVTRTIRTAYLLHKRVFVSRTNCDGTANVQGWHADADQLASIGRKREAQAACHASAGPGADSRALRPLPGLLGTHGSGHILDLLNLARFRYIFADQRTHPTPLERVFILLSQYCWVFQGCFLSEHSTPTGVLRGCFPHPFTSG
jgi:hypothetical protein